MQGNFPHPSVEPRCFLAIPFSSSLRQVRDSIINAVLAAGFRLVSLDEAPAGFLTLNERLIDELSQADCIIADLTGQNPNVFYKIGLARAMGKGLFLLAERGSLIPSDLQGYVLIFYDSLPDSLSFLTDELTVSLERFRRFPRRTISVGSAGSAIPFLVDWDSLERSEAENLCRELLIQMGYRRVDWEKGFREFDLIAELPKRDPDGFEYNEIWFISMGRNAPMDMVIKLASEPGYLAHRIMRDEGRLARLLARSQDESPITILLVVLDPEISRARIGRIMDKQKGLSSRESTNVRIRVWDRDYLTSLVQQFPHLAYKYFSAEGRSQSGHRKSWEELYRENVDFAERLVKLNADLTEEKDKRIRAERDAIWKDISFTAAHKIGNPIFAIETALGPLQKRILGNRISEALDVLSLVRTSVEKANGIVGQFKSLTRAQEIRPVPTLLRPILEDACRMPREHGVICEIDCPEDLYIKADPERLSECFDELVANSTHWFDKPQKEIKIIAVQPAPIPLPVDLPSDEEFTFIRFRDNGSGVVLSNKGKIFDAFFTTYEHGTGLGLALVRRIIEGHGGAVFETGVPGEGAEFEIYLPSTHQAAKPSRNRKRREKKS